MTAADSSLIVAVSGGAAVSTKSGSALGLAGAATVNIVQTTTDAVIQDSTLSNVTGAVAVTATNGARIISIAAGLGGASQGYGIAGSVAYNTITADTEAYVSGGGPITADSLAIMATDASSVITVAGSLAYGGTLGIGAGIAYNDVNPTVKAYLSDADATISGALTVQAENQAFITVVAAGIAVAVDNPGGLAPGTQGPLTKQQSSKPYGLAAAVGLAIDTITADVSAYVTGDGTDTLSAGSLSVAANDDNSKIVAVAGGVAVGLSNGEQQGAAAGAGGAAFAFNNISNSVTAYLSDIRVTSLGNVAVTGESTADIEAYTIGGAVAGALGAGTGGSAALAGAGAVTINTINKDVLAYINDGSSVTTSGRGTVTVSATDQSTINAVAGGVAVAGALSSGADQSGTALSVGLSVAENTIQDKTSGGGGGVQAFIDNSTISAAGDLDVTATSTPTITVVSFAGGLALSASLSGKGNSYAAAASGAAAINTMTTTVHAAISNTKAVQAPNLTLSAGDNSTVTATVVGASSRVDGRR